ncbi:hypothetical protein B0H14DRAFT_3435473 [Mycena olivaceomarginata]|nr:hypothetical protein B0H14DRAFT_3435473 [Mycena olivaceomarginata]
MAARTQARSAPLAARHAGPRRLVAFPHTMALQQRTAVTVRRHGCACRTPLHYLRHLLPSITLADPHACRAYCLTILRSKPAPVRHWEYDAQHHRRTQQARRAFLIARAAFIASPCAAPILRTDAGDRSKPRPAAHRDHHPPIPRQSPRANEEHDDGSERDDSRSPPPPAQNGGSHTGHERHAEEQFPGEKKQAAKRRR